MYCTTVQHLATKRDSVKTVGKFPNFCKLASFRMAASRDLQTW